MNKISRPKSLTEHVTESLRDAITNGEIKLGESLSENRLSELFKVSKTPVREALFTLKQEGLVDILPQKGSYVFSPDADEVTDLCQYRSFVEPIAIEQSMIHNREAFLWDLHMCIENMEEHFIDGNCRRFIEEDSRFHNLFFKYCGNRNLIRNYQRVRYHIDALRCHLSGDNEIMKGILKDHKIIYQCLNNGELNQARKIIVGHVLNIGPSYEQVVNS